MGMDFLHVSLEQTIVAVRVATTLDRALAGFLLGVRPFVDLQIVRLGERFGAAVKVAKVWPLAGVGSEMLLQAETKDGRVRLFKPTLA
jgi:hypothetical protein